MDAKDFKSAINMEELNLTAIAGSMYPQNEKQSARSRLSNKINNKAGQRLTDDDLKKGEEVLRNLADAIYAKLQPLQNGQDQQP